MLLPGVLALTGRRKALTAALSCLGLDVVGRITMVALGFFPVDTTPQVVSMVFGTVIVVAFGAYLWASRRRLPQ